MLFVIITAALLAGILSAESTKSTDCAEPPTIPYTKLEKTSTTHGSYAVYVFQDPYKLIGHQRVQCLFGEWINTPRCNYRSCIIPVIENGVIGFYKAVQRYQRISQEFVKLQVGETVKPGESVVLRCEHGFIPVNLTTSRNGDAGNIWCREGVWSKSMQCAPSKCLGEPPPMENGSPVIPNNTHGKAIWYECKNGFEKLEKGHVECVYGTWKGYTPVCGDSRCFKNSLNYPGLILPTTEYLTSRTGFDINCEEGYEKTSSKKKIRCFKGKWEVESNPCSISDQNRCFTNSLNYPGLKLPEAEFSENYGYFEIRCEEGYRKTPSKNRISCFQGKWDVESNPCTISDQSIFISKCEEEPPAIQNGRTVSFDRDQGSEVRYRCDENFEILNGSPVICNRGKWEGDPPQCQEIGQIHQPEIGSVRQNNLDRETHSSTTEARISSSSSFTTDTCYCTYDFPTDIVAYSGNKPVDAKSLIWKGGAISLRCLNEGMDIVWTNGLAFYGGFYPTVTLTCDTCKNWSRNDLPECRVRHSADSFLIFSNDMKKILPGGIIEIPRHTTVSFECINLHQVPTWNPNYISGTYVNELRYNGDGIYRTSLQITDATDSHAGEYHCYFSSDRTYRHTALALKIADITCPWIDTYNSLVVTYTAGNSVNSRAIFRCGGNLKLIGKNSAICNPNGQWSNPKPTCENLEIQCPLLEENTNSGIFYIQYENNRKVHSVAIYACQSRDQKLLGSNSRECMPNGQWSGSYPSCEDITCPWIYTYNSLVVTYTGGNKVNSRATFRCGVNLKLIGKNSTTCMHNGQWSNPKPTCENYKSCDQFEDSENLEVYYHNNAKVGSTATFSCVDPYKLVGSRQARCLQNGSWNHALPSCEMPKCSIGSLSQNLPEDVYPDLRNVTEDYVPYGTELQLVCNPGSYLSGDSIAKCGEQERWEYGNVRCIKACVLEETRSRLKFEPLKDYYTFGESITLSCPPGQKLSSNTQRVMCLGSSWSDPIPECVDAP